jgi:hypothetical protein
MLHMTYFLRSKTPGMSYQRTVIRLEYLYNDQCAIPGRDRLQHAFILNDGICMYLADQHYLTTLSRSKWIEAEWRQQCGAGAVSS